ncbi:hypothetical protein [Burkholderia guangdongensis]|uniref:hypothetical protein n=1 Tax=Burkholderia guangdongensis TaxID=1792500 RepID=UPI0015C861D3|nr:hypothetical protein [Burkholderia guangdongensis]
MTEKLHQVANAANSVCLSKSWRGYAKRYRLRCDAGHAWSALGQSLLRGGLCPTCAALSGKATGQLLFDGIDQLRAIAKQRGGKCLSRRYDGVKAVYTFCCANGHTWQTRGATILYQRSWCPHCPRVAKEVLPDGLERLHAAASKRGGRLLSDEFVGTTAKYRFECAAGHVFETFAGTILYSGGWCRRCGYDQQRTIDGLERLREAARARGGRCLSDRYDGRLADYAFQCANGHTWQSQGGHILRGTWCRQCANAHIGDVLRHANGLALLREKAASHGGVCLDDEYRGTARAYRFRCGRGHEWRAKGANILHGRWCKRCSADDQRSTLAEAQAVADARGGLCLSDEYVNARSHLVWQCHRGHVWPANLDNVKNKGRWCPDCKNLKRITNPKSKAWLKYQPKSMP